MKVGKPKRIAVRSEGIYVRRRDFRTKTSAVAETQVIRYDDEEVWAVVCHGSGIDSWHSSSSRELRWNQNRRRVNWRV